MGVIIILELVISIILIILLYLQSGKVKNVGSSIIGTKDVELFEKTKRRGMDRFLHITSIFLISLFLILPIIGLIIV